MDRRRHNNGLSPEHFISRLRYDPWPRAVADSLHFSTSAFLGMSGISSRVQAVNRPGSQPAWCQTGCFTSGITGHSSSLEGVGPSCSLAWTDLVHLAEEEDASAFRQGGIVTAEAFSQREVMSWAIVDLWHWRGAEMCPAFSVDWVYLMSTRRPESQVPFSPRCLSARPSLFFWLPTLGFLGWGFAAHSEPQQLWGYSGFIDLSKEPQTCWAGAEPGPRHPRSYRKWQQQQQQQPRCKWLSRVVAVLSAQHPERWCPCVTAPAE